MNPKIVLRNLTSDDILSVFRLGAKNFDWPSESILWTEAQVQWYCDNAQPLSFVADYEGTIIGCVLCFARDTAGYLGWLIVDAQWRGQGIGTQLVRQSLSAFQSVGVQTITTIAREDGRVDQLLKRFGFQSNDHRKLDMTLSIMG